MSTDLRFTPVPVRPRRDGWTPLRQTMFLLSLADIRCVVAAASVVGLSWQSAYRLRARPDAGSFAAAWDRALAPMPVGHRAGRAIDGVATPIRYRGQQVGERRRHDNRLAMYLLSIRRAERHAAGQDAKVAHRDPTNADALLDADLATGIAPSERSDFRADVGRTSSPSANNAAPARHGPARQSRDPVPRPGWPDTSKPPTPVPRSGANSRGRLGRPALPRSRERLGDMTWPM